MCWRRARLGWRGRGASPGVGVARACDLVKKGAGFLEVRRGSVSTAVSLTIGDVPMAFVGRGCMRCGRLSTSCVLVSAIRRFENPWGFPLSAVVEALLRRAAPPIVGAASAREEAWSVRRPVLVILVPLA